MAGEHWEGVSRGLEEIVDVRGEDERAGGLSPIAEKLGAFLSHAGFLLGLLAAHLGWIVWNSGWLPVPRFDAPPYPWLAMIASVEAPFLSVMILMHQRSEQHLAEVREETELQIALHNERQSSRVIAMIGDIHAALGLDPAKRDEVFAAMTRPLDPKKIVEELEEKRDPR